MAHGFGSVTNFVSALFMVNSRTSSFVDRDRKNQTLVVHPKHIFSTFAYLTTQVERAISERENQLVRAVYDRRRAQFDNSSDPSSMNRYRFESKYKAAGDAAGWSGGVIASPFTPNASPEGPLTRSSKRKTHI